MICILEQSPDSEIIWWLLAADLADARRQIHAAGALNLAQHLYRMESGFEPRPGKYELAPCITMLVG